jgi:hypothetical protein
VARELEDDPEKIFAFVRQCKRGVNRLRWRQTVAVRTSAIGRAVRVCEKALGLKYDHRTKERCAWTLFATVGDEVVPAIRVSWVGLHRFEEKDRPPVNVTVLQPAVVDVRVLSTALASGPRSMRRRFR